jgi:long-chain fatty acid transport protein
MKKIGIWVMAGSLLTVGIGPVMASGFSVYEQSAKASAQAGAWVARADDAAANWYNPAAMARMEGMQMQFGINLITTGSDLDFITGDQDFGLPEDPVTFAGERNDVTPIHLYFVQKINDKVAWGFGINNPYGLVTEWRDLPVTLSSQKAELHTFVINPNLAFAVDDHWSLAFGIDYIYADVKEFSRAVDQSELLGSEPLTVVGGSDLTGDGDDWSFNLAVHYAADKWSFGVTYRGEVSPEIKGDVLFSDINPALGPDGLDLFPNGPGRATLDLPAQAAAGVAWSVADDWVMEFDISWAQWSSFQNLAIDFENETFITVEVAPDVFVDVPVVEDINLYEGWDDTMAFRLGAAWRVRDRHELRFGALMDQAPTRVDTLRPSIPDGDRTSVTVGYGYIGEKWSFDAYYMPLFFDDSTADGDHDEGVIDGTYEAFVHLAGVTFNYRF